MSESASKGQLALATRELLSRWAETRTAWRDQKAEDFDGTYLAELSHGVNSALRVLEELDNLLERIHGDCE